MSQDKTASTASTASRARHVPQRTCVACRQVGDKRELVRIVRLPDDRVSVDTTGKQRGRGAYLCARRDCWDTALKRRSLERALRLEQLHPDDRATLTTFAHQLEDTMVD